MTLQYSVFACIRRGILAVLALLLLGVVSAGLESMAKEPAPSELEPMKPEVAPLPPGKEEPVETRRPRLKRRLEAPIPPDLLSLKMERPYAKVLVQVGEEGDVEEWMCLEATHYGLREAAGRRAGTAEFLPALQLGTPVSLATVVYVEFYDPEQRALDSGLSSLPLGTDVSSGMEAKLYRLSEESYRYSMSEVNELDDLLLLTDGRILILEDEGGRKARGACLIEFYVNPDGEVRFPRVIETDGPTVSMSAILSLKEMRFVRPRRDGRPTYVKVRQPFNFTE